MTFSIKRGDTSPPIKYQLISSDGSMQDISNYQEVSFFMRNENKEVVVTGDTASGVTVEDAPKGIVSYSWSSGDTSTVGTYDAEWEVVFGDGTIETFPNNSFITVKVKEDIQ